MPSTDRVQAIDLQSAITTVSLSSPFTWLKPTANSNVNSIT